MQELRVLFPVLHYPPVIGGFEIFIKNLAERLSQELPIWIVTGRVRGVPNKEPQNQLTIIRTSLVYLRNLSYSSKFYILTTLPFLYWRAKKIIKKEEINLVHCHGFFSGLIGWRLNKKLNIPYVITIQSADLNIYHPQLPRKLLNWVYRLERKIYQNAAQCHSVSTYLQDYYKKRGVSDSVVIPNGVDQEIFKPNDAGWVQTKAALGFKPDDKIIVSVSRLEKKNGTADLIRALPYLRVGNYQLLIIGDGTERQCLEKLAAELSLADRVKFLGEMDNSAVVKYLQAANLFVRVPLAEGFGIVFIEAMACGVPVIGTPVGGITDIITDGQTGLFCLVNNPQDVAKKINEFFTRNIYAVLRDNGLRLVQEKYQWADVVQQIKNVYYQICLRNIPKTNYWS